MTFKQSDRIALLDTKIFLDEHYNDEIRIKQLSQRTGVNPLKLQLGFRILFNRPIYTYLTHLRMTTAAELLINTELSIKEIAVACGYNRCSDFTKLFKKNFGKSPKIYRNHQLNALLMGCSL